MKFDYYYGAQADQFSFIRIPRIMLTEETFAGLTLQAKMLYSVLLDRMTLSMKNGWFDEKNRAYIIYQISEIQADLGFSKKKAMDFLSELEHFGLVEKKKRGFGLPSLIYVKSFMIQKDCSRAVEKGTSGDTLENARSAQIGTSGMIKSQERGAEIDSSEVPKSHFRGSQIATSEVPESTPLNSKTNRSYIDLNQTESNHISSAEQTDAMGCDVDQTVKAYEQIIKENIDYASLLKAFPYDRELIQGIVDLILETVVSKSDPILIASERYPAALVKSKLLKLNYMHIEYVMSCFKANTTKVKNIKKYLLAALFNAPTTMDGYYRAEVNHDMPQFAG